MFKILKESTELKKQLNQANVLLVSDDISDKRKSFIRSSISNSLITGEIYTADKQDLSELFKLVNDNLNKKHDLLIIKTSLLFENNIVQMIRNLRKIVIHAKQLNCTMIFINPPDYTFIKDESFFKTPTRINQTIKQKILNDFLNLNNIYEIDISNIDEDSYFEKNGFTLSDAANKILLKHFLTALHKTTQYSITKDNEIDIDTKDTDIDVIDDLGIDTDEISSTCIDPKYPNARVEYHPDSYTGSNGIRSRQRLSTVYGTELNLNAANLYKQMIDKMHDEGVNEAGPSSGFRTYETQYNIVDWDYYECYGKWRKINTTPQTKVAPPGRSNHGTGTAIDVQGKAAQDWIRKNGLKYGWAWYTRDGGEGESIKEPWHFTFIKPAADPVEPIPGCMDSNSKNYNPDATEDDGSCEYDEETSVNENLIFNMKNKKHIKILREELIRVKKLLENYNDSDVNNNGYPDDTESTTSELTKQEIESIDRDSWTYIRGILKMINDTERYRNTDELKQFVAQQVRASTTNDDDLKHNLIRYALNGVEAMMKLNIAVQGKLDRINPINFSASMPDELPDSLRVSKTPWGDYSGD